MLELLPPATQPWREVIVRRHLPVATHDYRNFRACLRWEFGFSCAFCLLHESDLSTDSAAWDLMGIEHAEPTSERPDLINQYENCFYSCRFCSQARGRRPSLKERQRLLNPCVDSWREHFELVADEIRVRGEDPDAFYTLATYELNDPRKVRLRRKRRMALLERLEVAAKARPLHDRLLERARETGDPSFVDDAFLAWKFFREACEDLKRFSPIPEDASHEYTCSYQQGYSLPKCLAEQVIKVETDVLAWKGG